MAQDEKYKDIFNQLGNEFFYKEDYKNAILYLDKAIEFQPDNPVLYFERGASKPAGAAIPGVCICRVCSSGRTSQPSSRGAGGDGVGSGYLPGFLPARPQAPGHRGE